MTSVTSTFTYDTLFLNLYKLNIVLTFLIFDNHRYFLNRQEVFGTQRSRFISLFLRQKLQSNFNNLKEGNTMNVI